MRLPPSVATGVAGILVAAGALILRTLPEPMGLLYALSAGAAALVGFHALHGGRRQAYLLALAPLLLVAAATGGMRTPLLPVFAVWLALSVRWTAPAGVGVAAVAMLVGLVVVTPDPEWRAVLAAVLAVAAGLAGAALAGRTPPAARPARSVDWQEPPRATAPARSPQLAPALESVRAQSGARRAVIWEVDDARSRASAVLAAGGEGLPPDRQLAGDPMRWVLEEMLPLRLERAPRGLGGADAGACVVPLGTRRLLSLEYAHEALPPDAAPAADAGRYLEALIDLEEASADADRATARAARLLEMLRMMGEAADSTGLASLLLDAAMQLTGATGAAAAAWQDGQGVVLALTGEDGGPQRGTVFSGRSSEMALAARGGAMLVRERSGLLGRQELPVAHPDERWFAQPRALVVLPLAASLDSVQGVLALWHAHRPTIDPGGLNALQAIAPFVALEMRQLERHDELRLRADTDALTGLPNRGAFNDRLHHQIAYYRRYHRPLSLVLFDVDHFKSVNDTYGHDAGDEVLRVVAETLAHSVRETDVAARFGGEEFVVLLPETDLPAALDTAERIRSALAALHVEWQGTAIPVTASFGVSSSPRCTQDPGELVPSADQALYRAKQGGRNRVVAAG